MWNFNSRLNILRGWITKKTLLFTFIIHQLPIKVCFYASSVKRKENDMDGKYRILGGPAENASSPTFSQIEQFF